MEMQNSSQNRADTCAIVQDWLLTLHLNYLPRDKQELRDEMSLSQRAASPPRAAFRGVCDVVSLSCGLISLDVSAVLQ